jgi:predicted Zn-dependent protease
MTDGVLRGLEEMVKRLSDRYPDVRISPEIWFFSQIEEKLICDLFGVRKDQTIPRTFIQVLTKVRDERGRSAQTRVRLGEVLGPEFLGSLDDKGYKLKSGVREQLAHWMELAMKLLDAQTISPEELAQLDHLILDRSALGVFVHEALGHNFEADIIKAGNSGVVDREGRPRGEVASEMVHIVDGPLLDPAGSPNFDQGFGTEFIDDEGVEVIPKFLARNGRVSDFILNRETAAHYNRAPNGGAFSELGDPRLPRMSNTYILPADHSVWYNSLEELLKDVRQGIILIGTLGGAVGRDGMSSSVQLGYRVKDGKLQELIKPANFSAQTLYALRYVDGFAGKLGVDDIGFCGKGGQSKPVGDGGPEFTRIAANPYVSVTIQG